MITNKRDIDIDAIVDEAFAQRDIDEYKRAKGIITVSANGTGNSIVQVSSQYDWLLQRITIGSNSPGAIVQLFENVQQDADMMQAFPLDNSGRYSDQFGNILYVPSNTRLIIAVMGGLVSDAVSFNLQGRLKQHRRFV